MVERRFLSFLAWCSSLFVGFILSSLVLVQVLLRLSLFLAWFYLLWSFSFLICRQDCSARLLSSVQLSDALLDFYLGFGLSLRAMTAWLQDSYASGLTLAFEANVLIVFFRRGLSGISCRFADCSWSIHCSKSFSMAMATSSFWQVPFDLFPFVTRRQGLLPIQHISLNQ